MGVVGWLAWLVLGVVIIFLFIVWLIWVGQILAIKAYIKHHGEGQGIITDISRRKRR